MLYLRRTLLLWGILFSFFAKAQENTDNKYAEPLAQVLKNIETRYGVAIRYPDSLVKGKVLNYARWRFRPDVEETLNNVLAPFDLKVKRMATKNIRSAIMSTIAGL